MKYIDKHNVQHAPKILKDLCVMHHAINGEQYYDLYSNALREWKNLGLDDFAEYFRMTWGLHSDNSSWQIFHTERGYATTNNPVETFNSALKAVSSFILLFYFIY
jgi:hypothetical protein